MKPYFERDGITIYHGDALRLMPLMPAGSVDLVLSDPPYGETSLPWDSPVAGWLAQARWLLSPRGSLWCFGSLRSFITTAHDINAWQIAQEIVWEKHNGSSLHNDRFRRVHELILQLYPLGVPWSQVYKSPVYTHDATRRVIRSKRKPTHLRGGDGDVTYRSTDGGPRLMRSVIYARSCHGTAVHPTQKPMEVVMPLLRYSLPPDGVLLDPFMGSGTALDAARRLGCRAIGIDNDERYCAIAAERLSQAVLPLGGGM